MSIKILKFKAANILLFSYSVGHDLGKVITQMSFLSLKISSGSTGNIQKLGLSQLLRNGLIWKNSFTHMFGS